MFTETKVEDKFKHNEKPAEVIKEPEVNMYIPWIDDEDTSLFEEEKAKPTSVEITRKVTLVIDADSLVYQACHLGVQNYEKNTPQNEATLFDETVLSMLQEQKEVFASRVQYIKYLAESALHPRGIGVEEEIVTLYTPKAAYRKRHGLQPNFRYALVQEYNEEEKTVYDIVNSRRPEHEKIQHVPLPGYKANRVGMPTPTNVEEVLEWALSLPGAVACGGCEADDYAYKLKTEDPENVMLAVIDKDILGGTPSGSVGHINFNKNELQHTTQEEADLFYYRQCMSGDSSDGIPGIYRVGAVKAKAALPEWKGPEDAWAKVLETFNKAGYTEEYAILMMRLVNLNQLDEHKNISLWTPPPI